MGDKLVVGPFNQGLRTDREPFVIDNDSFPILINAYQWRGRVKRKRGTQLLGRLQRYFDSTSSAYNPTVPITPITLGVGGTGNLLTGFTNLLTQAPNATIVPGSVTITDTTTGNVFTDNSSGVLTGAPAGAGTINYVTGAFAITSGGGVGDLVTATFRYFPDLTVMGLEDLVLNATQFPGTIAFDTRFSYNIVTSAPYSIYDVSFYKNPPVDATNRPAYVPKTTVTSLRWNGQNYQQFWTTNYQGAMWTTNGIAVPFNITNIGMQFKAINTVTVLTPTTATLQITAHGLVIGDFIFINEVLTTTGINFQTGYITAVPDVNNVTVTLPFAAIATNGTGGIAQYLTSNSDANLDCIRWYDGDPTNGSATAPVLNGEEGWVNFSPPLSSADFSIADLPADQYYLVGARLIIPYKDRLIFAGPVVQSSTSSPIYLPDSIIYSQNGTPYYTASFTGSVTSSATTFRPLLLPANQTSSANAYFCDLTGFGGYINVGIAEPILTVSTNDDVLIFGASDRQLKCVYSGNDIVPFVFYIINSELGSGSTFSAINFDRGVFSTGEHGIILTNQNSASRIDSSIPDQVFEFRLTNNGPERITAQRDYINEWCYLSYPSNENECVFPSQTLLYNYKDESWGVFNETYTTYGQFKKLTGQTWAIIGETYPTWSSWNDPWEAGESTLLQPEIIAGNQQGFVLIRSEGTNEGSSLYITSFSSSTITSHNHCLSNGDYIVILGSVGTISSQVNGNVFSVNNVTTNTFDVYPTLSAGTYLGGGVIRRMYVPFIQTKQFPTAWGLSRKTRLGPQQYLFSTTSTAQLQLLIYLSQNADDPFNDGSIVPSLGSTNPSLIYSTVLFTCQESTNLGLTAPNSNLQQLVPGQSQTWHRMNTSLIGDTVQVAFTLSDSQMRDTTLTNQFAEIECHGFILDVSAAGVLA